MDKKLDWENFEACCKHIEGINDEFGCSFEISNGEAQVTSCQSAEADCNLTGFQEDKMEIITYQCPLGNIGAMVSQMEREHTESERMDDEGK